jgi:surfeit locus 1 family protein
VTALSPTVLHGPYRRLLWPAFTALVMLALLIGLGTWQVYRLRWKEGILAAIDRAEAAPPVPLPAGSTPYTPAPFTKVSATGTLRGDLAVLYGIDARDGPTGPVMGAYLVEPLERPGAPPLLVDRGWIPSEHGGPPPQPVEQASVQGYVRMPDQPGLFSPEDDPGGRRFYTLNPASIGAAVGLADVAPYTLVVLGPSRQGVLPEPAHALPRPPNNHLEYAITWYGLAVVLVAIFFTWCSKVLRDGRSG